MPSRKSNEEAEQLYGNRASWQANIQQIETQDEKDQDL
jgi:hypothetical protein